MTPQDSVTTLGRTRNGGRPLLLRTKMVIALAFACCFACSSDTKNRGLIEPETTTGRLTGPSVTTSPATATSPDQSSIDISIDTCFAGSGDPPRLPPFGRSVPKPVAQPADRLSTGRARRVFHR